MRLDIANNGAQMAMMQAISSVQTQEELDELQLTISKFFADKAQAEIEAMWNNGQLNQAKLDEIRKMHLRTPYK